MRSERTRIYASSILRHSDILKVEEQAASTLTVSLEWTLDSDPEWLVDMC